MFEDSLGQVLERWEKAFGQYGELKAAAQPAVVRWEWASGERYSLLPFHFKRFPGRGRALKGPPTLVGYYIRYGFDERDRPRLHRFYDYLDLHGWDRLQRDRMRGFERDELPETFYTYANSLAEIIEFSVPPRIPLKVQHVFYEDGRVIRHISFRLNGYTPLYSQKGRDPEALYEWLGRNGRFKQAEQYIYEGSRLIAILSYSEVPGISPFEAEERFTYDESGKLLRIDRLSESGSSQLVYRKRDKGQTFKSIREAATQKMIESVIERLRNENIREKLCCVELSYQAVSHHFPPSIVLGLESDRQSLLESGNSDACYYVFAPALMGPPRWLEITDPDTLEICSQLEQEVQMGEKWETARVILRDVAAALTRHDWRGILDVTPDFVVFAIDWEMEGDHLAAVLGASASEEQLHQWQEKGWL